MKNNYTFIQKLCTSLVTLLIFLSSQNVFAAASLDDTYIKISSTYYFVAGTHANAPSTAAWSGLNIGIFPQNGFLPIGGKNLITRISGVDNICSGTLRYAIYPAASSPPSAASFSSIS